MKFKCKMEKLGARSKKHNPEHGKKPLKFLKSEKYIKVICESCFKSWCYESLYWTEITEGEAKLLIVLENKKLL